MVALLFQRDNGGEVEMTPCHFWLVCSGIGYTDHWLSALHRTAVALLLVLGHLHFTLKVLLMRNDGGLVDTVEALHYSAIFTTTGFGSLQLMAGYKDFLKMRALIRSGFWEHGTRQEVLVRAEANAQVIRVSRILTSAVIVAYLTGHLKETVLSDKGTWVLPYNGWFPFAINSWPRYAMGLCFELLAGTNVALCTITFTVVFVSLSGHLSGEMRVLQGELAHTLKPTHNVSKSENAQYNRLKCCIQHHIVILQFFKELRKLYGPILFTFTICISLMICTLGFIITDPKCTKTQVIRFMAIVVPEMTVLLFFSFFGQRISNANEELSKIVSSSKWYQLPRKIQKALLMVLLKSNKPLLLVGGGLQVFSHKGLEEILERSYSLFNMFLAIRK